MASGFLVLSNFLALTHAYTIFWTNCSSPSATVNFVSSNNTRGTIDILWSCLFTIMACVWTVQHLNIPEQRDSRDKGWRGDTKWALKRTWTSTKWVLLTALAPEILISKNWGDLLDIKADIEKLRELAREDNVPWSRTHSLFANMGGFVIRGNVPDRVGNLEDSKTRACSRPKPNRISQTQATSSVPKAQQSSQKKSVQP